jgi:NTP pyrophosphatase (non-canonical NTP hydrolase)
MTDETALLNKHEVLRRINGFLYLASPYAKYNGGGGLGREMAYRAACQLAAELEAEGLRIYAPIAHGHPVAEKIGHEALTHADWIDSDRPFMQRASALVVAMMPGWRSSAGVQIEIDAFALAKKPIFFLDVDTRELVHGWRENAATTAASPPDCLDRLRSINIERCEAAFHKLDHWGPMQWACAMAGEAGEVCNAVKKLERGDGNLDDIKAEVADTIIYLDLLAARLGFDLWPEIIAKFNVVSERKGVAHRLELQP